MSNIRELENSIIEARDYYWNEDDILMSDGEYDLLIEELRKLDPNNKLLTSVEFPEKSSNTGNQIKHDELMLSLEKAYNLDEIEKWCKSVSRDSNEEFIVSYKFDGMASIFDLANNTLATRGNGEFGENITDKLPLIDFSNCDLNKANKHLGEIIIKLSDFDKCELTRKSGDKFKLPRSLVSGVCNSTRKDTPDLIGKVQLTFMPHNTIYTKGNLEFIKSNWFEIEKNIQTSDYPLDGVVIKLADEEYGKTLGATSHHYRHSIAYKFPDESKFAKVINIDFQSGKRVITPVCYIEPTLIAGSTIKKITLHNYKNVIDKDLYIGDIVNLVKRGGIIPYVNYSTPGEIRIKAEINSCPACNGPIKYEEPNLICLDEDCSGSIKKKLLHCSKTLEVDGLSSSTIDKLVEMYDISNVYQLLDLDYQDFIELSGFGETSAAKLSDKLESVRSAGIEDWKILTCLCLEGIGVTLSKPLLNKYTLQELINIDVDQLTEMDGIGPERAEVLLNGIEENIDLINDLLNDFYIIQTKGSLNKMTTGANICFSGKFTQSKAYFGEIAKAAGLNVVTSVTKTTNILATAEPNSIKTNKARDLGITILTEDEFVEQYA